MIYTCSYIAKRKRKRFYPLHGVFRVYITASFQINIVINNVHTLRAYGSHIVVKTVQESRPTRVKRKRPDQHPAGRVANLDHEPSEHSPHSLQLN